MSIKSIFFETSNSPRACLGWILVIVAVLSFLLWDSSSYNLKTDGRVIELQNKAVLFQRFENDTLKQILSPTDSVKLLAIDRSSFGQKWLVETSKGNIGWIDAADLKDIKQIVTAGTHKGDTVSITGKGKGATHIYTYLDVNGEEQERSTKDFVPVFDGWENYAYNRDGVVGVCTQKKFEAQSIDKGFNEVNKDFGSPVQVATTPKGFKAGYSWKAYNPSTGEMSKPTVFFSVDSIAYAVSFGNPTKRAAKWLKNIPFSSSIIDWSITSLLIRGSRYDAMTDPMMTGWRKAVAIGMIPVMFLVFFVWMFLSQQIPVLAMGWLVKYPRIFCFLSDGWLKALMGLVTIVSAYIWSVMMMAWGMFPFWSIVIVVFSYYSFLLASSPLCRFPHLRCPKCHRLYSIEFDHEDFEYDEIKKGTDIVRDKLLGTRTEKWKAWTEVTTTKTYRDGRTETSSRKDDMHTEARDYNTYLYIDYNVTYRLDHYRNYYKCRCCGFVEDDTSVKYTELSREKVGVHTAELAGDTYRTRW